MDFFDDLLTAAGGFFGGPLGGIATSLITGGLDFAGQEQVNSANTLNTQMMIDANRQEAEKVRRFDAEQGAITRGFNSNQAHVNRQFEREMSNTSHQREVKDLLKAGLNPILSVSRGASTPGGSMASAGNVSGPAAAPVATPRLENSLGRAVNSAMAGYRATTDAKAAQEALKGAKIENVNKEKAGGLIDAQIGETRAAEAAHSATAEATRADTAGKYIQNSREANLFSSALQKSRADAASAEEDAPNKRAERRRTQAETHLHEISAAEAEANAKLYQGEYGPVLRLVEKLFPSIGSTAAAAAIGYGLKKGGSVPRVLSPSGDVRKSTRWKAVEGPLTQNDAWHQKNAQTDALQRHWEDLSVPKKPKWSK